MPDTHSSPARTADGRNPQKAAGRNPSHVAVVPDPGTRAAGTGQAFLRAHDIRTRQRKDMAEKPRYRAFKWILILTVIAMIGVLGIWTTRQYYRAKNSLAATTVLTDRIKKIYTLDYQDQAQQKIDNYKKSRRYTPGNMLVLANPYGTNTTSLYTYFETDSPTKVSYTVSTPEDRSYPAFTRSAFQDRIYQTSHEFSVIGLIPAAKNTVTYTVTYEDGHTDIHKFTYVTGDLWGSAPVRLKKTVAARFRETDKGIRAGLAQGLFAVFGLGTNSRDYVYLYDADGILRAEFPMMNNHGKNFSFHDGLMYYVSDFNQISAMDSRGKLVSIFNIPSIYQINSAHTFDSQGNLLLIASDKSQLDTNNLIVKVSSVTGTATEYINFSTLLNDYRKTTRRPLSTDNDLRWNWLMLDSIQYVPGGSVIVSSQETSTIMKIRLPDSAASPASSASGASSGDSTPGSTSADAAGTAASQPSITYFLGPHQIWDATVYSDYLYRKSEDFSTHAGQHSVEQLDDGDANSWISEYNSLRRKKRTAEASDGASQPSGTGEGAELQPLGDGQHLVYMFNNNYGYSPTNTAVSWPGMVPGVNTVSQGDLSRYKSRFYMYRVDENSGTYALASSFDIPYSPRYSNVQMIPVPQSSTSGDTSHTMLVLANTAQQHTWGIYSPQGDELVQFIASGISRTDSVYCYTFTGFYFS